MLLETDRWVVIKNGLYDHNRVLIGIIGIILGPYWDWHYMDHTDGCQNYGPFFVHIKGHIDIDVDIDTDS